MSKLKKIILVSSFIIVFISFFVFNLNDFFSIDYIKKNNEIISEYINSNFFYSIIFSYLIFLISIFFFLPIIAITTVLLSFIYGPYINIPLSILIITLGGTLNFYLLKQISFNKIFIKAKKISKNLNFKIKENEFQYSLLLRFIPMPYIVQNAILVLFNIKTKIFIISTLFGVSPYVIIYSIAGYKLKDLIHKSENITIDDLVNYENFFILIFLILFIYISMIIKKKFN
tara:strand:- start:221 stop:907 length:687 start_codon:yes stop_codon:yes gene_type:complete